MAFVEPATAVAQDEFTASPVATCALGTRAVSRDGRVFRYCQAGTVDLAAGLVVQSLPINNAHSFQPATVPLGATSFLMSPLGEVGAANLYAEGYFIIMDGPGKGIAYVIAGHAPISTSAPWRLTLASRLVAANPGTTLFQPHPYKGVIVPVMPLPTSGIMGVTAHAIPAGQYGWLVTWGVAPTLVETSNVPGLPVSTAVGLAGAVRPWNAAGGAATNYLPLGVMMHQTSENQWGSIFVRIGA